MSSKPHSTLYLTLRSLEPTPTSLVGCIFGGIIIVALNLLALSLNYGTILPTVLDGQWATAYTNHIVQPIESAINNPLLSGGINIVIWGLVGLLIYTVISYTAHSYHSWRETEANVQISEGVVIQHPLQKTHLLRAFWRLAVGVIFVIFLVIVRPIFRMLINIDERLFVGHISTHYILQILWAIVVWALILHVVLVCLRLYLFRTRLGTDIMY